MIALSWTKHLKQRRPRDFDGRSMSVRGVTGNNGLYIIDSLALWSVTPISHTADDLLCGLFASILSAANASIADPRILLDSVVLPTEGG